jgi:dienelactone hydrolase
MARLAVIVVWIVTCGSSVLQAQSLEVNPSRTLVDQSAVIRASGLDPKERVTIRAHLTDGDGHTWSSEAEFVADASGTVDTSKESPAKGSYTEISAMGLIWAMMPTEKHVTSYKSPHDQAPQVIDFALLRQGHQAATAQLEQLTVAADLRMSILRGHLHGMFFVPNTAGRHPGVLVVGGSEGGVPSQKAAWLASHGFAALALAYFHYEDLPPNLAAIPLEYFGQALEWMMQRPEIDPERVAVVGTSRGGELALQLGSLYPQIKAVVAFVPANVRYPACCGNTTAPYAWAWKGQPLTYAAPRLKDSLSAELAAGITVERTNGPLLLIGGQDDGVWPSSTMIEAIADRLRRGHFSHRVEILKYSHAGHRAGRPEIVPTWHSKERHPISGRELDLGGSARGDAESTLDAIPKVLAFLNDALGPSAGR